MFMTVDQSLRAEEQGDTSYFLGYMVFENFDDAEGMETAYKKVAKSSRFPEGYACAGGSDFFVLGANYAGLYKIESSGAQLHQFFRPSQMHYFTLSQVEVVGSQVAGLGVFQNPLGTKHYLLYLLGLDTNTATFSKVVQPAGYGVTSFVMN